MKNYLCSKLAGLEFEEEVNSLDYNEIEGYFSDYIEDCFFMNNPLSKQSQGFFPDPWEIETDLFNHAEKCLNRIFDGKVFKKSISTNGKIESTVAIDIAKLILENRINSEQAIIDSGKMIIKMLENFLEEGKWQYGLQRENKTIIKDVYKWPKYSEKEKTIFWQDSKGIFKPIIWFGLNNQIPIKCWTFDNSILNSVRIDNYDTPFSTKKSTKEPWVLFWFNTFWHLDWNAIFDNNGDNHIIWMFSECGMNEPIEAFNKVRNSCPIKLDASDSASNIYDKILSFFKDKQNSQK